MKPHPGLCSLLWITLLSTVLVSCSHPTTERLSLASFTANYVEVSINLERSSEGKYFLSATFTPPEGYHLYSKDIPLTGIDGVGRPTLLRLTTTSALTARGAIMENRRAQTPDFEPKELLVYPVGAVKLSLPVELPPGNDWIDDEVSVTYMACSASLCKPPVVEKIVAIRVPGADMLDPNK